MNFLQLAPGERVFLDANVLVYHLGPDPTFGSACQAFVRRIETGDLTGYTSADVFSDVAHRLMTLDAFQTFGWPYAGITRRLQRHPAEITKLVKSRAHLDDVIRVGIKVLPVESQDVFLAADLSRAHGLLSGDALIAAMMQRHTMTNLASNDSDFDRVPGITRYGPV